MESHKVRKVLTKVMKDLKTQLNKWRYKSQSRIEDSILSRCKFQNKKFAQKYSEIPVMVLMDLILKKVEKVFLKYVWKLKQPQIPKTIA